MASEQLIEGIDYTIENGLFVFTSHYLTERGYCCRSGCRHCPYGFGPSDDESDNHILKPESPGRSGDSFDDTASCG